MRTSRGFTLIEISVATAVMAGLFVLGWGLSRSVLSFNGSAYDSLSAQADVLKVLNSWTGVIRSAQPSENGAYALATAATGTFTFYSDYDDDGTVERVRYYLSGTRLRRGVIEPTGSPAAYVAANEVSSDQVRDVVGSATAVFQYYGAAYDGTQAPLAQPVAVGDVRLVKMTVTIDRDPRLPPGPVQVTTQVSLRNLKDES